MTRPWPHGCMQHTPKSMLLVKRSVQQVLNCWQCGVRLRQPAVFFAESASDWLPWRWQLPAVLPPAEQLPLQLLLFPARPALLPSSYLYLPAHSAKQFVCYQLLPYFTEHLHFMYAAGFDCYPGYSQVLSVLSGYHQARITLPKKACRAVGELLLASLCSVLIAMKQSKLKQHLRSGAHVSIHLKFEICMHQAPSQGHCYDC